MIDLKTLTEEERKARRREQLDRANKKYRDKNREKIRASKAEYRKSERFKKWRSSYISDPEKRDLIRRDKKKRRRRYLSREAERTRLKRANSTSHRLNHRMSAQLYAFMKREKGGKSWKDVLGYELDDLKFHLERQFSKGMSWENMGEWHIDHIVPKCELPFDGLDSDNFKFLWSITNLRPMWKTENIEKSGKRTLLL